MKKDNNYIEELLEKDAKSIEIDNDAKNNLKNKILQKNKRKKSYKGWAYAAASILAAVLILSRQNFNFGGGKTIPQIIEPAKVHASQLYIKGKAKLTSIIATGNIFSPVINPEGTKILYSSEDNMYEMSIEGLDKKKIEGMKNGYTPQFSKEGDKIVFAKNDGIYIQDVKTSKINTVIKSKNHSELYSRPNFTPEGDIIYFKAVTLPDLDSQTGRIKTEIGIYKISIDGKNNTLIVEGSNPDLSKDGKLLAFEDGEKIYVLNLETRERKLIDEGRFPAWSPTGNYISYIKSGIDVIKYDKLPEKTNLYLEKQYSNIWIADFKNLDLKYKLTEEEFMQKDEEIEKWAKEVTDTSVEQHFVISNKYSYFDSSWGKDDKDFFAVRSSEKDGFELMRFELENK